MVSGAGSGGPAGQAGQLQLQRGAGAGGDTAGSLHRAQAEHEQDRLLGGLGARPASIHQRSAILPLKPYEPGLFSHETSRRGGGLE